jgi:head-tail adaptor
MSAGRKNQPLAIESPNESLSDARAPKVEWSSPILVCERWGEILGAGSREVFRARQNSPETSVVIKIQGFAVITTKMRVRHKGDGRVWDIKGVEPQDGKAVQHSSDVWLRCEEGMRAGS